MYGIFFACTNTHRDIHLSMHLPSMYFGQFQICAGRGQSFLSRKDSMALNVVFPKWLSCFPVSCIQFSRFMPVGSGFPLHRGYVQTCTALRRNDIIAQTMYIYKYRRLIYVLRAINPDICPITVPFQLIPPNPPQIPIILNPNAIE